MNLTQKTFSNEELSQTGLPIKYIKDPFVPDYNFIKRTWTERIFSFPWTPFEAFKKVYNPTCFLIPGYCELVVLCSPHVFELLSARAADGEAEKAELG